MSSPQTLVQRNIQAIEDYQIALELRETSLPVPVETFPSSWTSPSPGLVKTNWDASLETQRGIIGRAVVIRDHRGQLVAARCMSRMGCPSPLAAEALVALMAVKLSKELGLQNVHFQGDAKSVVDAVNCVEDDRSRMGHVMEDLKVEVQSILQWKMSFIKREGNNVAHVLAKYMVHSVL